MLEAQEASNQALLDDLNAGFYTDEFDAEKHELEISSDFSEASFELLAQAHTTE